jgi:hypothetical protein
MIEANPATSWMGRKMPQIETPALFIHIRKLEISIWGVAVVASILAAQTALKRSRFYTIRVNKFHLISLNAPKGGY